MRSWIVAVAIVLTGPLTALAQDGAAAKRAPASRENPAPQAQPSSAAMNAEARKREDARQKGWDDRMRRATRSMCDRC